MSYSFFAMLARMQYITRWGLMRNTARESVQEHSHMVAVLAHALALIRRDVLGRGDVSPDAVAVLALYHDAPEILTGDLPTPVKYHNPAILDAYREVESVAAARLLALLPDALQGSYAPLLREATGVEHDIIKAADKLAAYIKCAEELKAGNREFQTAAAQTLALLEKNPLPEVRYFMEHFLPAFALTLDEL